MAAAGRNDVRVGGVGVARVHGHHRAARVGPRRASRCDDHVPVCARGDRGGRCTRFRLARPRTGRRRKFLRLDGTPVPYVRSAMSSDSSHDAWFLGKHHRHDGIIQVVTRPAGCPKWISELEPGSIDDISAGRIYALYSAVAAGLLSLTDRGYTGAGIGSMVPAKGGDKFDVDIQTRDKLINGRRARAESLLERSWRAHERITFDSWRIEAITRAALVLVHLQ